MTHGPQSLKSFNIYKILSKDYNTNQGGKRILL